MFLQSVDQVCGITHIHFFILLTLYYIHIMEHNHLKIYYGAYIINQITTPTKITKNGIAISTPQLLNHIVLSESNDPIFTLLAVPEEVLLFWLQHKELQAQ